MRLFIDYVEESVSAFLDQVSHDTGIPKEVLDDLISVESVYEVVCEKFSKYHMPVHLLRPDGILHNHKGKPSLADELYRLNKNANFKLPVIGMPLISCSGSVKYYELVEKAILWTLKKIKHFHYEVNFNSGELCDFASGYFLENKSSDDWYYNYHSINEAVDKLLDFDITERIRIRDEFLDKNKISHYMNYSYNRECQRLLSKRRELFKKILHAYIYSYLSNRNNVVNWIMTDHWMEDQKE